MKNSHILGYFFLFRRKTQKSSQRTWHRWRVTAVRIIWIQVKLCQLLHFKQIAYITHQLPLHWFVCSCWLCVCLGNCTLQQYHWCCLSVANILKCASRSILEATVGATSAGCPTKLTHINMYLFPSRLLQRRCDEQISTLFTTTEYNRQPNNMFVCFSITAKITLQISIAIAFELLHRLRVGCVCVRLTALPAPSSIQIIKKNLRTIKRSKTNCVMIN